MPLYEYECTACHRRTEKIQKFSDAELTVCPFCNGPLERTLTAPAVHFAGGGWYKDGYASAKPAAASGEGGSGDAGKSSDAAPPAASGGAAGGAAGGASGSSGGDKSSASSPAAPAAPAPTVSSAPKTGA